jgi:SET family sugar efflux transporter-like MFS transporter
MTPDVDARRRSAGRALFPLGLVFLAVGIAVAVVNPFLSLFLNTAVHAGPVRVTVFLLVAPLAGVIASTAVGRLSDRRPIRRRLLIGAATAGLISTGLTAVIRDYWILLALAVTGTALAGSLFPQTFAYARQVLARNGSPGGAMGISTLRTVFSIAWVAGPPLASFLLGTGGFRYVYGLAAAMFALAALVAVVWLEEIGTAVPAGAGSEVTVPAAPGQSRWRLWLTAAAFTMVQCPLTLGVQALPLFIRDNLHGPVTAAGLILGLCAALEIPLMLGFGALSSRVRVRVLVLAGAGCGIVYYALAAVAWSVWVLAAAQLVNALFIAAVAGLGISYVQDMMPLQLGRATTMYSNSFPIGAMLAAPLFGVSQHFGFRLAYVMGAVLCAGGLLVLLLARPQSAR